MSAPRRHGEHSVARRLVLADLVAGGWARLAGCDLPQLMESAGLRVLAGETRTEGSETVVLLGDLRVQFTPALAPPGAAASDEANAYHRALLAYAERGAVAKLGFTSLSPLRDNSLAVERLVYHRLVLRLAQYGATPHVMLPVGTYRCADLGRTLAAWPRADPVRRGLEAAIADLPVDEEDVPYYDVDELNVLLLERGRGSSLEEWAGADVPRSPDEWRSVLWQLLYTLVCFRDVGLRHNDLHPGNVWIDTDLTPQTFIYFVDPRTYYAVPLVRGTMARVYDFDQATAPESELQGAPGAPRNTTVSAEFLRESGGPSNDFDVFTLLSALWVEPEWLPDEMRAAVLRWFRGSSELLDTEIAPPGGDYGMIPVEQMLRDPLFDRWRYALPQFDPGFLPATGFPNVYMPPRLLRSPATVGAIEAALEPGAAVERVAFPLPRVR